MRRRATDALRELGDAAAPEGVPALADYLADPRWELRCRAAEALGKLGEQGVPAFILCQ